MQAELLLEDVSEDLEILPGLIEEVIVRRAELLAPILKVWQETISWEEHFDQQEKRKTFTLVLKYPEEGKEESIGPAAPTDIRELLGALSMLRELKSRVTTLADNILNNIFK